MLKVRKKTNCTKTFHNSKKGQVRKSGNPNKKGKVKKHTIQKGIFRKRKEESAEQLPSATVEEDDDGESITY